MQLSILGDPIQSGKSSNPEVFDGDDQDQALEDPSAAFVPNAASTPRKRDRTSRHSHGIAVLVGEPEMEQTAGADPEQKPETSALVVDLVQANSSRHKKRKSVRAALRIEERARDGHELQGEYDRTESAVSASPPTQDC